MRSKPYILSVFDGVRVIYRSEHVTLGEAERAARLVRYSLPASPISHPGFNEWTIWHNGRPIKEWSTSA